MFITRESDYAMRVVRALMGETRLSVSDICEREAITAPFAYKILKKLQNAGIVQGYRGVHGGYALKKDPAELTLYDIYSAIESLTVLLKKLLYGFTAEHSPQFILNIFQFIMGVTRNAVLSVSGTFTPPVQAFNNRHI